MKSAKVFADASYWLALMRENEAAHSRAVAESKIGRRIITTEFVVLELGNACHRASDHADFLKLVATIRENRRIEIVPLDSRSLNRGLRRMAERPDKDWSLTDCVSFLVMEDEGLTSALTTDRHFEQAGFVAVLR